MTLNLWFEHCLLDDGWASRVRLCATGGVIDAIARDVEPQAGDERHAIGLPGLPNLHSHAFQRAMAGLAETAGSPQDSFWSWRELMYRFVARLEPDALEAISAFAYMEMLEAGYTRVGEFHYLHHDPQGRAYGNVAEMAQRIAAAARATGIGLTLLPVFYAHGGFGAQAAGAAQARFLNDLDGYARLHAASREAVRGLDDAIVGVAPHSLRAVAPRELTALATLAPDAPMHLHIAEQQREVDDCLAWSGQRPVAWLHDHADVDARWCLVHATHVDEHELARIAASGAVVGLCPITEANLGDGIFPAVRHRALGGRWGIGSDSNVRIDAAEELRTLEYGQRLQQRARNRLAAPGASTGRSLFDAALAGGAHALGVGSAALRIGAPLDLVSLDAMHAALAAHRDDAILDAWIFAGNRSLIDCVWRRGTRVVSGGRHRDRDTIARRYRTALSSLLHA